MTTSRAALTSLLALTVAVSAATCSKSAPPATAVPAPAARGPLDIPMMAPQLVATLEKTHVKARFAPQATPDLAVQVIVPKDWRLAKPASASDGAVTLGSAVGPPELGSPAITASAATPGFEVPLDAWLRESFARTGHTIVALHAFPGVHGVYFEATGTRLHDGAEEVRRSSVRADGGHIFAVTCLVPRAHWDEVKDSCWVAHDGLTLEKQTGNTRLEKWLTAEGKHPDFRMAYPASWDTTTVPPPRAKSSVVDVRLAKDSQATPARLQVTVEPLSAGPSIASLDHLRDATLERARGLGFVANGPLDRLTEDNDPRSIAVTGWLGGFAGKGRLGSSDGVVRMGFIRHDGHLTTFLEVAPEPAGDTTLALRAQRAFEIARATVEAD